MNSAADPERINAPTPRATLLHLNTPEGICVGVPLQINKLLMQG